MSYSPYVAVGWMILVNVVVYMLNEHSFLRCWAKRKKSTFFTSNRSVDSPPQLRAETWLAFELHDSNHLVASWFLPGKPGSTLLLLFRASAGAYFAFTLLMIEFNGEGLNRTFLIYFTNWTFILFGLYTVLGMYLCLRQLARSSEAGATPRRYGFLDKFFALTFVCAASCAAFLTAFYWAVLYDKNAVHYADNALRHGGNVAIMWADFLISRAPVNGYWFQVVLAYTSVYAVFMWLYSTVGHGAWPYEALDWRKDSATGYYIVLPILVYVGFILTYVVAGLREFLHRGKCCCMCCPPCCCCNARACREDEGNGQFQIDIAPRPGATNEQGVEFAYMRHDGPDMTHPRQ